MKALLKKNWFFLIFLFTFLIVFAKRYIYLPMSIVANPDSQVIFSTDDKILEQKWQPTVKEITAIEMPYLAENNFLCDVKIRVFSDDYSRVIVEQTIDNYAFNAGQEGNILFSFPKVAVVQGERYHIQIALVNASAQGIVKIPSGSNYGGCSVGGKDIGQALALTVTFLKFSKLFWVIAVFFPVLMFSLLFMIVTGKKWEETVALSLFIEGIIIYIFGLFDHLTWGIGVVYILAVFSLLPIMYLYNRKNWGLRDLLSPGLWIYFVLCGIILVTCKGDWIAIRDELRHWEIAARDMFYYDSFAKHIDTTVILTRYMPFAAIIEYVFEFMNGVFSEDILFIAYQTMLLSVLTILCKSLQKNEGMKLLIPTIVAMVCVPAIFFNNIASCIMVDPLISAVFLYILICYFTDKMSAFNYIRIGSALVTLVLIKDIGLIYAGMAVIIILGDILFSQIQVRRFQIMPLLIPVIGGFLAIAVFFSWQIYLCIPPDKLIEDQANESVLNVDNNDGETVTFVADNVETDDLPANMAITASGITIEGLRDVLSGNGEEFQYVVAYKFVKELFDGKTYSLSIFSASFMDLLVFSGLIVFSLGYFGFWQDDKRRMYRMTVLLITTSVFLCAFLLLTYWFSFSMYEALELTSISRYLAPYICAVVMFVYYMIYNRFELSSKKERCLIGIFTFFLIVSMPIADVIWDSKDKQGNATEEVIYGHSNMADILRSVAKRGEKAYFICSDSGGLSEYVFRNTICPIISVHADWSIVSSEEALEQANLKYENKASLLSVEDWKERLAECQYVVIFHADEWFKQSYGELFEEGDIEDGSIYQVQKAQGDIELELIGRTGIKEWR